jgi:predicted nucleic acid-binding protein
MLTAIVLDTGPLGLAASPGRTPEALDCQLWIAEQISAGRRVYVPEIADYEVRRELQLRNATESITRLDVFNAAEDDRYLPITTAAMRQAARFWAAVRRAGLPTADRHALDADVILAAQAMDLGVPEGELIVATTNVRHLARLVPAARWQDIEP